MAGQGQQIVLKCSSGQHRVRLDQSRFWASARCPKCKTSVDPFRINRVFAVLAGGVTAGRMPWSSMRLSLPMDRGGRWLFGGAIGYFVGVLGVWVLLWAFGDRWWPGTLVLFGPRWVFLLPVVPLVFLAAVKQRVLLLPILLAGLIVLFPIMGLRTGVGAASEEERQDVRVMTYNIANGRALTRAMWEIIGITEVDVVAFQECSQEIFRLLQEVEEWHHDYSGSACLSSRFPIDTVAMMERESFEAAGGSGMVVRYVLATPQGPLGMINLHLDTPRAGLEPIRSGELSAGLPKLREKTGSGC